MTTPTTLTTTSPAQGKVLVLSVDIYGKTMTDILLEYSDNQIDIHNETISTYKYEDLEKYSVVIFSFRDAACACYNFEEKHQDLLIEYLNKGGSVLWTHDHIDYTKRYKRALEEYAGFENFTKTMGTATTTALINERYIEHPLFRSYYQFQSQTFQREGFPISPSHSDQGRIIEGGIDLMNFTCQPPSKIIGPYLLVKESQNKARCAFLGAGHTYSFTVSEKRLFVNIVWWLARFPPLHESQVSPQPPPITNTDDSFFIVSENNPGYVFDIEGESLKPLANLILAPFTGKLTQRFKFVKSGCIACVASGLVVDIKGGVIKGANIIQYGLHGGANQLWKFHFDGSIRCQGTNLCLEEQLVVGSGPRYIIAGEANTLSTQLFRICNTNAL